MTDYREGDASPKEEALRTRPRAAPTSGYIGLQNHGPGDVVLFREISVKK